ncbi:MAG: Bax inhibitor-1 family protein [Robiginitomaculum sp.]
MNNYQGGPISTSAQGEMDLGLRSFMLGTYKYMIMAMGVSGLVALLVAKFLLLDANGMPTPLAYTLTRPSTALILSLGIMFVFGRIGAKLHSMSIGGVKTFLFGFAAVIGIWLSVIAAFKDPMISVRIFFMAAAMFGGVSLIGYTIKKDLSGLLVFFTMAFIGAIVMLFLNAFVLKQAADSTFVLALNALGLLGIAGLTAWKTQMLKRVYYSTVGDKDMTEKYSVFGAAMLLLAFINMFSFLMSLFGRD